MFCYCTRARSKLSQMASNPQIPRILKRIQYDDAQTHHVIGFSKITTNPYIYHITQYTAYKPTISLLPEALHCTICSEALDIVNILTPVLTYIHRHTRTRTHYASRVAFELPALTNDNR